MVTLQDQRITMMAGGDTHSKQAGQMVTLQDQRITMVACGDTFTVAVSEGRLHTLTVNRLVRWSLCRIRE